MWPYWIMFLLPAITAMVELRQRDECLFSDRRQNHFWFVVGLVLTLLIGFRMEVGGDWGTYLTHIELTKGLSLAEVILLGDPAYQLLNWAGERSGYGIFLVNLVCGGTFTYGLIVFCRNLPRPVLALAVAVPYLVIVVAMGYSRQGVALGVVMLALVALERTQIKRFIGWIFVAAMFHKSAIILLPVAILASTRNKRWMVLWVLVVFAFGYFLFLHSSVEYLYVHYIEREYQSAGTLVRLLMNALPSAILLLWWRHYHLTAAARPIWRWFAVLSLFMVAIYFVIPSSTAVDRIALYLLPIQLVVFSYFPDVLANTKEQKPFLLMLIVVYYSAVLFVWLSYAKHAIAWLPYQSYLL